MDWSLSPFQSIPFLVLNQNLVDGNSVGFVVPALENGGGGRVVRWCWVNFQCRGVLQFGLQ